MSRTLDEHLTRIALVFNSETKKRYDRLCQSMSHFVQNLRFQLKNAMYPHPHYQSRNAVFERGHVVQFLLNIIDKRQRVLAGIIELVKGMQSALFCCVFLSRVSSSGGRCCCSHSIEAPMGDAGGFHGSFLRFSLIRSARWRAFPIFAQQNPMSQSYQKTIQNKHDF